jgi:hypothetical protein
MLTPRMCALGGAEHYSLATALTLFTYVVNHFQGHTYQITHRRQLHAEHQANCG